MSVRPVSGFFGKSCRAYRDRDTIFGFIYLGKISRSEKSKIQNVIWYPVIATTSSFFWRKNKNRFAKCIWPKNRNFSQVGPYAQCKNKNIQLFADEKSWSTSDWRQTSSTQESLKGPPLPCGCNLFWNWPFSKVIWSLTARLLPLESYELFYGALW